MSPGQGVILRLTLAAALAAGAAPRPGRGQVPESPRQLTFTEAAFSLPAPREHRIELAGGAVLYLFEDPMLPLVEVAAALRVGTFLDPPDKAGLARLAGAMLRRGGAGDSSAEAFDERVDALGLKLDSGIGDSRGGASLSAPTWSFDEGLGLFVDMLARPRFQEDRLESARANLRDSLSRRNDDPLDVLEREWQWLLYGRDHPSTRPPTPASVDAITRADLVAFHRRHFGPGELVLAISGDVRRAELVPRLNELLRDFPARTADEPNPWPPPLPTHRPRPGLYLADADTPQTKVLMGHLAAAEPRWSEREAVALWLMNEILGGGDAVSRIPGRLRAAAGLVYRAMAHFDTGEPGARDFRVFFETTAADTPAAIRLAREEILRLRRAAPHPKELQVVRRAAASSLRISFDTAEELAGWFAEDELLGRPHARWERSHRMLAEIEAEEVRRAAERWLRPEELVYLVVGRRAELLGGAEPGASELERAAGHPATLLPVRDPLTLEPLEGALSGPPASAGQEAMAAVRRACRSRRRWCRSSS